MRDPDDGETRTEPRDIAELYERLAGHPDQSVQQVGLTLAAAYEREGREWARVSVPQIRQVTGLSRRAVQYALADLEEEKLFKRERQNGRPSRTNGRGDYYAPALPGLPTPPEHEPGSEAAPARAGPNKKRPDRGGTRSGREARPQVPDRAKGPKQLDQP